MTGVWLKDTAAVLVCSDGSDLAGGLLLLDAVRYRRPLWGCCQDTSDCSASRVRLVSFLQKLSAAIDFDCTARNPYILLDCDRHNF